MPKKIDTRSNIKHPLTKTQSQKVSKQKKTKQAKKSRKIVKVKQTPAIEKKTIQLKPITRSKVKKVLSINSENFVICKLNQFESDYDIIDKIGEGAFGAVFRVRHKVLKLERALKKINKNPDSPFSSFDQIDVLKKLDHRNILKIYQFYESEESYLIVTEIFEGKELFDEIVDLQKLNQEIASRVIREVLVTLIYTHSLNIAHRDIKPQNILVKNLTDKNLFKIKIIDWGLGTFLQGCQFFDRVCGTPQYAAPEIFQGNYSLACDMWSLGVLAFILLTGDVPFKGKNRADTITQVKKAVINLRKSGFSDLSQNGKDFINKLLQKDASKRMNASSAIKHKWITQYHSKKIEPVDLKQTLERLKEFNISNHFGVAVVNLINNHFSTNEQKQKLQQIFTFLDTNGDGVLSLEELIEGYAKIYGNERGKIIATQTFEKLDVNNSGTLEYSQFLAFGIKTEKEREKNKLRHAFNIFDTDKNGTISFKEISSLLQGKLQGISEQDLETFIMEDLIGKQKRNQNSKEQVNFEQFYLFMMELMNKVNVIRQSKKRESQIKSQQKQEQEKRTVIVNEIKIKKTESFDEPIFQLRDVLVEQKNENEKRVLRKRK